MGKSFGWTVAMLLGTTGLAQAGGIDRAVFDPGFLYADGNYAEFSLGVVAPEVSGAAFGASSGNMADVYSSLGGAIKLQVNDKVAFGLTINEPVGANVGYDTAGYVFDGTNAEVNTTAITGLVKYALNSNVSAFGGVRIERAKGVATVRLTPAPSFPAPQSYTAQTDTNTGYGYVLGAAYEKPEIALRVALSYVSAIDHDFVGTDSYSGLLGPISFTTTVPQGVKLDFQTGVAADTLVFGSVYWKEWSKFDIITRVDFADTRTELSTENEDTISYTLGVGRKFNDRFSGAISAAYEPATEGSSGNLSPTNGSTSVTLAGIYTTDSKAKITAGVSYGWLGDAATDPPVAAQFTGSTYVAAGVKVGWSF